MSFCAGWWRYNIAALAVSAAIIHIDLSSVELEKLFAACALCSRHKYITPLLPCKVSAAMAAGGSLPCSLASFNRPHDPGQCIIAPC